MVQSARTMALEEVDFRLRQALRRQRLEGRDRGIALGFIGQCKRGRTPTEKQEIAARRIVAELDDDPVIDGEDTMN